MTRGTLNRREAIKAGGKGAAIALASTSGLALAACPRRRGDHAAIRRAVVRFEEAHRTLVSRGGVWRKLYEGLPEHEKNWRSCDREALSREYLAQEEYNATLLKPAISEVNDAHEDLGELLNESGFQAVIVGGKFYRGADINPSNITGDLDVDAFAEWVCPSSMILNLDEADYRWTDAPAASARKAVRP